MGWAISVLLSAIVITKATIKLFPKNLHSGSTPMPQYSVRSIFIAVASSRSNYYYNKEIRSLKFAAATLKAL